MEEVPHLDTLEMWKFGDYKHYTSLKLLTKVLGVPSPKDDIDGSEVAQVYYEEKKYRSHYYVLRKDVITVAQIVLKLRMEPLLNEADILSV